MNASMIEAALANRYSAPEYAFLLQVRNGTGFQRTVRTADALAFSLYPSRGLTIIGFEIKVTRGDWKRELENPDKAEDIARFCHTWNIVAPKGVVPVEELPLNWGLIELGTNGKLRTAKAAVAREPEPLTPLMIASIMRNISNGMIPRASIQGEIDAAVAACRKQVEHESEYQMRRYNELEKSVREFEEASGVRIDRWGGERIGEAVQTVMRLRSNPNAYLSRLERIKEMIDDLNGQVGTTIDDIRRLDERQSA